MNFISYHQDRWHTVGGEDGPQPRPPSVDLSLLTQEQWHAVRDTWPAGLRVGVILANTVDIETLAADLPRLGLVVLQFPKWVDGRAYTQARLLRARYRFTGEIRATGDVLVDMTPLLARTGFDAAQLRRDQKPEVAERALGYFAGHYQGDTRQPLPAFARDLNLEVGPEATRRSAQKTAELFAGQGI